MKNVPDEQQVSVDPKREQIGTILRELLRCSGAATQTAAAMIGYDFAMESAYKIAVENEDLRQHRDERIDAVLDDLKRLWAESKSWHDDNHQTHSDDEPCFRGRGGSSDCEYRKLLAEIAAKYPEVKED